jgi:hypothetical protein
MAGKATTEGEERRVQLVHRCRLTLELSQRANWPWAPCCSRVDGVCRWRRRGSVTQADARQADADQGKLALDGCARGSSTTHFLTLVRPWSLGWSPRGVPSTTTHECADSLLLFRRFEVGDHLHVTTPTSDFGFGSAPGVVCRGYGTKGLGLKSGALQETERVCCVSVWTSVVSLVL